MRYSLVGIALLGCMACGGTDATSPPPYTGPTGTVFFALSNCQAYAKAEYVVDSTTVGIEPITPGALSKGYEVPSGRRATIARVFKAGATNGLWTFRDVVQVPTDGSVTANLSC